MRGNHGIGPTFQQYLCSISFSTHLRSNFGQLIIYIYSAPSSQFSNWKLLGSGVRPQDYCTLKLFGNISDASHMCVEPLHVHIGDSRPRLFFFPCLGPNFVISTLATMLFVWILNDYPHVINKPPSFSFLKEELRIQSGILLIHTSFFPQYALL